MNDRLTALRLFQRVARTGSFSGVAREHGLSQPSVSRIIAQLEHDVGATLFARTTRAVTLTDAGGDYLARIEPILAALDEADQAARGTGELRGLLRVALSSSFGKREVVPHLPDFLDRHPGLRIELVGSDARHDVVVEGVDVALRLGALPDSAARARRLGAAPRVLTASPDYLARHGMPATPTELARHAVIVGPGGGGASRLTFVRDGRQLSVAVEGRVTVAANETAVAVAVAGLGIVATSAWGCGSELAEGRLVRVLADWDAGSIALNALFPDARPPGPAARAFVDWFASVLGRSE